MANIEFPRQKLSLRQKTQKWGEECIEAALGLIGTYDSSRRSPKAKKQRNYDLYNGKFDKTDLEHVTDPLGLGGTAEMPASLQYYDVVSPIFNLLFGEESKRKFDYVVRAMNEGSISAKEEEKKKQIVDTFKGLIDQHRELMSKEMPDPKSEEEQQEQAQQIEASIPEHLKRMEKYFKYDFQDMNESTAHKLLKFLEKDQDLKTLFQKGWEDALLAGEEIYCVDQVAQEPTVRRVNPLEFYCLLSNNSDYVDDADALVEDTYMSINAIIDFYYEDLTAKQVDDLEKEQGNIATVSGSSLNHANPPKLTFEEVDKIPGEDPIHVYRDVEGNLRVTKVVWKSMRKIGRLFFFDEQGMPQEDIVNETYKIDPEMGERIEWMWINEYWEGTKLGENIYINIRPRRQQFRKMDNLSYCKSGYVGTIYNANNSQSVSLMDRLVPWIYLYITMWYRLELAIASNQGKIALVDLSLIPDGWDVEKWMYYAQSMKFGFVDSFNEGKKGQSAGKLAGNISTQNKVLDMETGNYIQQHVQLLQFVEENLQSLSGVTRQRLGSISSSELVGTTERAVQQSSHITEKWYEIHNHTKTRVLSTLVDVAKDVYSGKTKRFQYVSDDLATMSFKLMGDEFGYSEYGIFVSNANQDLQAMEALKSLTQAALQNDKMTISDVIDVYNSSSLADIRIKIKESEAAKQQQESQMQQQQMQMQQQAEQAKLQTEQAKLQIEQSKLQLEVEKENREDARNTEDNSTKLQIAQMNAMTKMGDSALDTDDNDNGIRDTIDMAKLDLDKQKHQETMRKNKADEEIKRKAANKKPNS
tara:strand:+ start:5108 stop:7540 length:2433 start_codon:yes stop_codon:yes gene_type:complete